MANKPAYTTILSTRAEKEIHVSWTWYEEQRQGLGDKFVQEIKLRLRQIERNPEKYPVHTKNYRETTTRIFPFLIIYRINARKNLLYVVSVFHTSRNPKRKYGK